MFIIPLLILSLVLLPVVGIGILAKRKTPLKSILLFTTTLMLFSLVALVADHEEIVTGTSSGHGLLGVLMFFINIFGVCLANLLLYWKLPVVFTWGFWITAILLNWIVLSLVIFLPSILAPYPRTNKIITNTFWICLLFYWGYKGIKNLPSEIESERESIHFLADWFHGR